MLLFLGLYGGMKAYNAVSRKQLLFCHACRTQSLAALDGNVHFACQQCQAQFRRIGVVFQRTDRADEEDRVPAATAKLKP